MLVEIKTAMEILSAVPSFFPDNSEKNKAKDERMKVLRAYLAEVQHNEEVLKAVIPSCKTDESFEKLKTVAPLLENSIGVLKDIQNLSEIQIKQDENKAQGARNREKPDPKGAYATVGERSSLSQVTNLYCRENRQLKLAV